MNEGILKIIVVNFSILLAYYIVNKCLEGKK
jgi:hypothetical protein